MSIWRTIKRFFTARDLREVYVTLRRSPYSFAFLLKLDRDQQKYVVVQFRHKSFVQETCSMSIEDFDDFTRGVLIMRAEIDKPLPPSAVQ
ncbi:MULTISPECIES: hypothetical protein [unclassified Mesorhizobium]|jgi:hypothetical protein|uniref:hypothetical protein n=1 Tax=unclassified Mesorhizobium TaxID=325217 RepID=UPI000FD4DB74|nr:MULTISPECIES: hypothetical protein [unclassified Mesorhizobium]RUU76100.1 hypothetical protein EOC06_28265 [Mesorhizobium sp. M7A.F.Ca.MR.362.00.0.0]RWB00830.1 MAG: hypothetical protein EOQ37_26910 [Mesorhizobium sp.]RWB11200.1 MAG: hypothetical protein EOQ39_28425 [Mesorhizobium sp.]RWN92457.1 MAG: hypothetical protein EOS05_22535 [Mesorhizobium sp.]RWO68599.1 MAG: hypothetical protein EOS17_14880 [Mesorhizobium sp.]